MLRTYKWDWTVIQDTYIKLKENNSMRFISMCTKVAKGVVCLLIRGMCKFTATLPKKHTCHREFNLCFIRHLDMATSVQGIQAIQEHTKQHSEEGRSQIQKMGNSVGQRT